MPDAAIDCLVFDFDGTLASLTIDFDLMRGRVAELAGEFLGSPPEHEGRAVLEWIEELAPVLEKAVGGNGFAGRAAALVREMEIEAAAHGVVFRFTDVLLADLERAGVLSAVITRNCTDAVRTVHPEIFSLAGVVLTRDHVDRFKPDPAHLTTALDRLGAAPGRSLMVGDHPMDVETGKRAGTLTAGVLTGSGDRAALLGAGADFIARDAGELLTRLKAEGLIRS
jgi:phosphoglycolate phosphatase